MSTWLRIAFEGAKSHAVPSWLAMPLVNDMSERGMPVDNFETRYSRDYARELGGNPAVITDWAFDIGGVCYQHEPREPIAIDGLSVVVPCVQWDIVTNGLLKLQPRAFSTGDVYYKALFWIHATVLTPQQREEAIENLRRGRPKAAGLHAQFEAELEEHRRTRKAAHP